MNLLNTNFNSNENMFLSLAFGCRNDVVVFNKFDVNGVAILSFKKYAYEDRLLTFTNSIDIIAGDFNYDFLKSVAKIFFRYFDISCPDSK